MKLGKLLLTATRLLQVFHTNVYIVNPLFSEYLMLFYLCVSCPATVADVRRNGSETRAPSVGCEQPSYKGKGASITPAVLQLYFCIRDEESLFM